MHNATFQRLLLVGLAAFCSSLLSAHNGAVAFAYPAEGITIDGDLSDWPTTEIHALTIYHYDAEADGPDDAVAHWRAAYDPTGNWLYVGVTMADDDYVKTPDDPHYSSHDFQVLYLDPAHDPAGSGVIAYEYDEDHRKIVEQESFSYYAQVKNAGLDDVELSIVRKDGVVTYEWKVAIAGKLEPGRTLGFDYAVFDKDTDQRHAMLSWGPSSSKFTNSGRIGDLILMAKGDVPATAYGSLQWRDEAGVEWPATVVFTGLDKGKNRVAARVDSTGNFTLKAPAGRYRMEVSDELKWKKWFDIQRLATSGKTPVFALRATAPTTLPPITVAVVPQPDLIPEKGLLLKPFSPATAQKVDAYVEAYRAYYAIPAVSLALIQDGKVVYSQRYGVENTQTGQKIRPEAVFEAASITKSVWAYVMNRLVQRGDFDLDRPLHELLPFPELEEYPEYKLMTARHVLTHVSGLPNWGARMVNKPGTKYGYSGEGFEYLKKVVAGGANDSLPHIIQSLLEKEVLTPLGMTNTYFKCGDKLRERKVAGHFDGIPNPYDCPDWPGMAFSMHTEAVDFAPFALALLERKGLEPAQAREMFSFQTLVDEEDWLNGYKTGYGLGVALRESPHGLVFGHGGNNGDFRCEFEVYDELRTGYVIFTNANTGGPLHFDFRRLLVEGK